MAEESDKIRHPKKGAMLTALAKTGNVTSAAKAAKIDRDTHYEWLKTDADYAIAVDAAMEQAADLLEAEARRRAETGVLEPVYQSGEKVGTIRRYSDTLLIFLLKGARPEKYRERAEVKTVHSGHVGVRHGVDLSALSEGDLDSLDAIISKIAGGPGGSPKSD